MTALQRLILDELEDTEADTFALSDSMMAFGFDALEQGNYQDKLNSNVLNPSGRSRI